MIFFSNFNSYSDWNQLSIIFQCYDFSHELVSIYFHFTGKIQRENKTDYRSVAQTNYFVHLFWNIWENKDGRYFQRKRYVVGNVHALQRSVAIHLYYVNCLLISWHFSLIRGCKIPNLDTLCFETTIVPPKNPQPICLEFRSHQMNLCCSYIYKSASHERVWGFSLEKSANVKMNAFLSTRKFYLDIYAFIARARPINHAIIITKWTFFFNNSSN